MYNGQADLRKEGEEVEYTPEMIQELIRCGEDPIYFAEHYCTIIHPDRGQETIRLYDFQKKMLKAYVNPPNGKRNLIVKIARQMGKCLIYIVLMKIRIRNKERYEEQFIKIGEFFNLIKNNNSISNDNFDKNKFIESYNVEDCEVETEDGWKSITCVHKTIPYDVYELKTKNYSLKCANNHIVMVEGFKEKFVKDLTLNDKVITQSGLENVIEISKLEIESENMYDITIDSDTHTYFTNGILSHNTTLTTIFLLWYALFNRDKTICVIANKEATAIEILDRIKLSYRNLPQWIQSGIRDGGWNKKRIDLANGSRIIAAGTSKDSISGLSVSLLFLDEFAKISNFLAEEFISSTYPVIAAGKKSKIIIVSCVTKDTYVFTDKGIKKVENFIDASKEDGTGYTISNYQVLGKNKFNDGNIIVNSGKVPTKIVTTTFGDLEGSLKHKLYGCKDGNYDWYKMGDLKVGDYISIKKGMNIWGNQDKNISSNYMTYLIGLYFVRGYIESDNVITIRCKKKIDKLLKILQLKFKYKPDNYDGKLLCEIHSSEFVNLIRSLEIKEVDRIIPESIMNWSKDIIVTFLQAMFDNSGTVRKGKPNFVYITTNKELLNQMKYLFLNMGIITTWRQQLKKITRVNKDLKIEYILTLNGNNSIQFYNNFQIYKERYKIFKKWKDTGDLYSRDDIPFSKDMLRYIRSKEYISKMDIENFNKVENLPKRFWINNRELFLSFNDEKINNYYEDNISEDMLWLKIKKIEDSENEVCDFSLNEIENDKWCHSVIYNGYVGHQTPVGRNHFYEFWSKAVKGANKPNGSTFYPISVNWWEHPERDEEWKRQIIADISILRFRQEFQCIDSTGLIRVRENETGKITELTIEDFYNNYL